MTEDMRMYLSLHEKRLLRAYRALPASHKEMIDMALGIAESSVGNSPPISFRSQADRQGAEDVGDSLDPTGTAIIITGPGEGQCN